MTTPQAVAERALAAARHDLAEAGSPAHLAVAVLPDRCEAAAIVHASRQGADSQARLLATELPDAAVLIVALHRDRDRVRFVVTEHGTENKLLVRNEVAGDVVEPRSGWI